MAGGAGAGAGAARLGGDAGVALVGDGAFGGEAVVAGVVAGAVALGRTNIPACHQQEEEEREGEEHAIRP